MKSLKSLLFAMLAAFSLSAVAVDGFQDLKFGMSLNDIKKLKPCDWKKFKKIDNSWVCRKFEFLGEKTDALVTFDDNRFVRLQILLPETLVDDVSKTLPEKYQVSSEPIIEEDKKKNKTITINYDEDTVSLITTLNGGNPDDFFMLLTYIDKEYLKSSAERAKNRKNKIKDGL